MPEPMRVLTVRQPYAWAIIHGRKDVENRTRNIAGAYRGPVAVHAAKTWQWERPDAWPTAIDFPHPTSVSLHYGAIIGVVDLVDVHQGPNTERDPMRAVRSCFQPDKAYGPCSPWAERDMWHLVLSNPRPLVEPVPYRGGLGLRRLDAETQAMIQGRVHA